MTPKRNADTRQTEANQTSISCHYKTTWHQLTFNPKKNHLFRTSSELYTTQLLWLSEKTPRKILEASDTQKCHHLSENPLHKPVPKVASTDNESNTSTMSRSKKASIK